MILLYLDDYNILSSLPNEFSISQVDTWVEVSINLQGREIYTTTLHENNGIATFYGFKDIVKENMLARGLTLASLTVCAADDAGPEFYQGKYVVFADVIDCNDERELIWGRFLTNRSYYVMPRKGSLPLAFFTDGSEQLSAYADCVCKAEDGSIHSYRYTRTLNIQNEPRIYYDYLSATAIQERLEEQEAAPVGRLLSYTYHVGRRSMTVYVTDAPFEVDFDFRNAFNIMEHIFVYGSTKLKTSFDRKEAVSQGVTSFYDRTVERKHEVETAPMGIEEAEWFNEFLASSLVKRTLNEDYIATVLISDISSEISDNAKDTIKMKFAWRYHDNAKIINTNTYPQMFSAPYNDAFK